MTKDKWEQMLAMARQEIDVMQQKIRDDVPFGPVIVGHRPDDTTVIIPIAGESTAGERHALLRMCAEMGCEAVMIAAIANIRAPKGDHPIVGEGLMAYVEAKTGERAQFFCTVHDGRTGFGPVEFVKDVGLIRSIWDETVH
jgi:hypothetical protein